MIFQLDEPTRFGDAWTLPVDGGDADARDAASTTRSSATSACRARRRSTWKGADGATIEGLLFYPIGYQPGTRYPLVVQLHGGPTESDKFGYGPGLIVNYVPVLAAKGYAVLRPNYRGSTGYGNAFLRDVVGNYFRNMHLDVMAGVDALIQRGHRRSRSAGGDGLERGRPPDQQADHVHRLASRRRRRRRARATGCRCSRRPIRASNRIAVVRRTPWQNERADRRVLGQSPLKDVANVQDADAVLRRRGGHARADAAVGRDVSRAEDATACRRSCTSRRARGISGASCGISSPRRTWSSNGSSGTCMGRAYAWERAPGDPSDVGRIRPIRADSGLNLTAT